MKNNLSILTASIYYKQIPTGRVAMQDNTVEYGTYVSQP